MAAINRSPTGATAAAVTAAYPSPSDLIHAILHGNTGKGFPEPPSRVVKIFISSTRTDFEIERQHLHEVILPKLERYCQSLSLDLLTIDPHWQLPPPAAPMVSALPPPATAHSQPPKPDLQVDTTMSAAATTSSTAATVASGRQQQPIIHDVHNSNCIDPHEFELQLNEIEECAQQSLATFFICLIGHKYRPIALPTVIASNDFQQIFTAAAESGLGDVNLLRSCYKENRNLHPEPHYVLLEPRRASRQYEEELEHIAKLVEYGSKVAAREGLLSNNFGVVMSAVHQQTLHALYCARQYQNGYGSVHSPTQRNFSKPPLRHHPYLASNAAATGTAERPSLISSSPCNNKIPAGSKMSALLSGKSSGTTSNAITGGSSPKETPPPTGSGPQTPTRRANRLMHQVSLQQAPTQQKIAMPRQTSVTTNYDLMQPPVDRMLCFIRQLEGVNFNNASVTRFFDVTPTAITNVGSGDDATTTTSASSSPLAGTGAANKLPLPDVGGGTSANSVSQQQQCTRQLYAPAAQNDIQQLIEDVILGLKKGNVHYFNISWSPPPDNAIQTRTYTLPANYIERFGETVFRTLRDSIEQHWTALQQSIFGPLTPGSGFEYPGDIVREAHSHLSNFRRVMGALGMAQVINHSDFGHLLHIRELLIAKRGGGGAGCNDLQSDSSTSTVGQSTLTSVGSGGVSGSSAAGLRAGHRHQPIIVTGRSGAGKSTLLAQVFTYAPEWLAENGGSGPAMPGERCDSSSVIRIVRQCGQSPSSNFVSELLRSLCIQISIAYGLDGHLSRSASAHELSELAICFQELLKLSGAQSPHCDLLIILDDLHHLHSALQSSALLGWMPWNLPPNVHFICSVALESESVLSILRSRVTGENFVHLDDNDHRKHAQSIFSMVQSKLRDEKRTLTPAQWEFVRRKIQPPEPTPPSPAMTGATQPTKPQGRTPTSIELVEMTPLFANMLATAVLSWWESFYTPEYLPTSVHEIVTAILDDLEDCVPYPLVRRICCYLVCTKYGLRESELYGLVQETMTGQIWPTTHQQQQQQQQQQLTRLANSDNSSSGTPDPYDPPRSTSSTWIILKSKMRHLLKEYYVQGQLYFQWRSSRVAKAVHERYLVEVRQVRAIHQELATAFANSFAELNREPGKETESIREADELWYHLLYSGNKSDLKSLALLNVGFLRAIVQGVSVCYLRCILDAVRSQILDWDIEQLYAMLKQSVHVITQEPSQLPVEALLWLVPFAAPGTLSLPQLLKNKCHNRCSSGVNVGPGVSSHLVEFLRDCYRWCINNRDRPLLHPVNIWLNLPVPPQVAMITSPWPAITRAASTPDAQHLIICEGNSLHFYHLPTKNVAKSFDGHKSTITCLHLSNTGKWLATGSDDSSVNVWNVDVGLMEINDCRLRHRFNHHTSGVLCVAINTAETLVLSGAENGAICAVNLCSGTLITRLEHHKSMVTCIGVNAGDDVMVSGSTDRTVVVWSLDTFCILNEILLMRPVLHMDISLDSTFLLLSLDDNSLQIRALTTGTGVHTLQQTASALTAVISYVRFAEDNCRCVVGYADGRLLLFDIHSARQLQSLNGHSEMITSIMPQKDDHFLITTGGNKIIIWNFYPVKRVDQTGNDMAATVAALDKTMHEINLDSNTGTSPAIGGSDPFTDSASVSTCGAGTKDGAAPREASGGSGRSSRSSSDRRKQKTASTSSASGSFRKKISVATIENHREPITCVCVSRDGQYMVTGGRDCLVKIWYSASAETHTTLDESHAPISCVDIAPNSQFVVSGSEDGHVRTWSLTLSMYLSRFIDHAPHSVAMVRILSDNKRALSADVNKTIRLWQADNGTPIRVVHQKPITGLHVHGGTCFAIGGKIENCLKYWQVFEPESTEKSVSHSDSITCFTCTHSGKILITGSQDMSLKVWEAATGKLTQVLVGHEEAISCVATAPLDETIVVSGAQDCNLIVWDMNTGSEMFTLTGHNANVMGVILTPDGSRALSYSEDNTLQLWDIKETGARLSILDVHHNIAKVYASVTVTYLAVWLGCSSHILPIVKHHNNSSQNVMVELPAVRTPVSGHPEEKSSAWIRGLMPNRNASALAAARTLKREQSFDSFYFEHMLHRGQSVDDFRKIGAGTLASPFGSREQLWHQDDSVTGRTSTGMTGTAGGTGPIGSGTTTRNRMISKLMNIGPKQKMLKKQQSMFACFPEFTTGKTGPAGGGGGAGTGSTTAERSAAGSGTGSREPDSSLTQQANGSIPKLLQKKSMPYAATGTGRSTGMAPSMAPSARTSSQDEESSGGGGIEFSAQPPAKPAPLINVAKDSSICALI